MGNAIAKKFNVSEDHSASAGHLQLWKIRNATSKDNKGGKVSLWTFDKTELASAHSGPITDKTVQEQIFQIMKKDMTTLKDMKSSNILQMFEVINRINKEKLHTAPYCFSFPL